MIKHNHMLGQLKKLRTFGSAGPVIVYHNKERLVCNILKRSLIVDKQIRPVLFFLRQTIQKRLYAVCYRIQHNMHFFFRSSGGTVNTDRSADTIRIADIVSHDQHIRRCLDQFL